MINLKNKPVRLPQVCLPLSITCRKKCYIKRLTNHETIDAATFGQNATRSVGDMATNASKVPLSLFRQTTTIVYTHLFRHLAKSGPNFNSPIPGNLGEECVKASRILEQFISTSFLPLPRVIYTYPN